MANERYDLDQLRADLACLESAVNVLERHSARSDLITVKISSIRDKIARLEAEADPWREAKAWHKIWRCKDPFCGTGSEHAAQWIDHLIAESAKLAKRVAELEESAVWGIHSQVDGHLIQSFLTREDAEKELEKDTSKPRFKEVRLSTAREIVKAITETQRLEKMFRVERDEAWSRIAELEAEIKAEDDADIADAEKVLGRIVGFDKGKPDGDKTAIVIERMPRRPHDRITMQRRIKMQRRELRRLNKKMYDQAFERHRLKCRIAELEDGIAAIDPDGYQLGDFRVMKTAQEIARYAMDRNMDQPVAVKTARRAIWAIKEFVEQARHWHGLSKLKPYRWTSIGRDDTSFIDEDFDATESPCDYDPDAHKPLGDMQPPFEGPIVGIEPVLDPARVLATSVEAIDVAGYMLDKHTKHNVKAVMLNASMYQKPYRLKGGGDESEAKDE